MINLDHHNQTPLSDAVREKMISFLGKELTSPHEKQLRCVFLDSVEADETDQLFLRESHDQVIHEVLFGVYFDIAVRTGKNHFIAFKTEDAAILLTLKKLEEAGCFIHLISSEDELGKFIGPKTALVTLSWANGLTGTLHDIEKISKICTQKHVPLHVDASYVLGKIYFSLKELDISYLTFSGKYIHGPENSGCLIVKKEIEFSPLGKEGVSSSLLVGFSEAAKKSSLYLDQMAMESQRLRNLLEEKILLGVDGSAALFQNEFRLPNVTAIHFPYVHHEALLFRLQKRDLMATSGGGKTQPLFRQQDFSSISFCLSRYTTEEEVLRASEIIIEEALFLQEISKGCFHDR